MASVKSTGGTGSLEDYLARTEESLGDGNYARISKCMPHYGTVRECIQQGWTRSNLMRNRNLEEASRVIEPDHAALDTKMMNAEHVYNQLTRKHGLTEEEALGFFDWIEKNLNESPEESPLDVYTREVQLKNGTFDGMI